MDELGSDLNSLVQQAGRVRKAPEHFLDAEGIRRVREEARSGPVSYTHLTLPTNREV